MDNTKYHKIWWITGSLVLLTAGIFLVTGNQSTTPPKPPAGVLSVTTVQQTASPSAAPIFTLGQRAKTSGCEAVNGLEDKDCTPGAIIEGVTKEQICVPGYSKSVRNVPESEKNAVYLEYGINSHITGEYEVDHLISLELGGSNDISNLWPEAAEPIPGFHEKDKIENFLHAEVCAGRISLKDAQFKIADNWKEFYH